jgi:uncharacterized protein
MSPDDLTAPLGQDHASKQRGRMLPIAVPWAVVAALSLFPVVAVGWAMLAKDPFGGEPTAIAPADLTAANAGRKSDETAARADASASSRPSRHDGPPAEVTIPAAPHGKTMTIVDGISGKSQEVVISTSGEPATPRRRP